MTCLSKIARRDLLPQRRNNLTLDYKVRGRAHAATLGYYDDGRLGEVFITAAKSGSDASIAAQEAAIAASFALQFGCPPEAMRAAMPRNEAGEPEGPLGRLLDLLAEGAT